MQVGVEDLSQETLFRVFDSLPGDFRLSVPYVARVVRIDGRSTVPVVPAVTSAIGLRPEVGT